MADAHRIRRIALPLDEPIKVARESYAPALDALAFEIEERLKGMVSRPYPPASRPGRPPHLRSGDLRNSITVRREGRRLMARVIQYGMWLDNPETAPSPPPYDARPFFSTEVLDRREKWTRRLNTLLRKEEAARRHALRARMRVGRRVA